MGGDELTDSGTTNGEGSERRRYERVQRRLAVTFVLEGQEIGAQTVDVSKTGALFSSPTVPAVGNRLLLNLSDRQNPELSLFLKVRVVRHVERDGHRFFAVEFGDAVARDPRRLRKFLDKVLGVSSGLIRVVTGDNGNERNYAFSFDSVHREGEERVKALQASLFSSIDEMEEADAILSNFGKMPVGPTAGDSDGPIRAGVMVTPVSEEPESQPTSGPTDDLDPFDDEPLDGEVGEPAQGPAPDPSPPAGVGPEKTPFFKRLTGLFKGAPKDQSPKGETLIRTQRLPTVVAEDTDLPIVYRMGTTRYQGTATRLYCAGLKCLTEQKLPSLYANLTLLIPLAGGRKISQIELSGDVTRVRANDDDVDTAGIFEVRLSMRTDRMHLDLYRALLEKLTDSGRSE